MQYIQLSVIQQVWIWQTLKFDNFSVVLKTPSKASAKLNSASLGHTVSQHTGDKVFMAHSLCHRSQSWTLTGFQLSPLKCHLYPQVLSVLRTEILCEPRPAHSTCKPGCDVFLANGICGTELGWCTLPEPWEALPGADFCGHKATVLGNY